MIIQCKCKCGTEFEEYNKWGYKREYVKGHHNRGKPCSDETKQKIREKHKGKILSEEHRKNLSINHADMSGENNPNYGKTPSDATRQLQSDAHKGQVSGMKGKTHSNKTKQLISIICKGKIPWNKGKILSDEHTQNLKDAWVRKKQNLNYDPKIYGRSGENHYNWQGGISKDPYCFEFNVWLKEEIKERDNHQCQNPDCWETNNPLCVHHIDYDKKNCSCNNLITLCASCNSRANVNRDYWEDFYNNILNKND